MQANRRTFFKAAGVLALGSLAANDVFAMGSASQIQLLQIVYSGGNWRPRPSALRRLAWEIHKRTAVDTNLEPTDTKPSFRNLASSPLAYLSGDRAFPVFSESAINAMKRFLSFGGTLIVDPAITPDGNANKFNKSVDALTELILPGATEKEVPSNHVIFRSFYQLSRPVGRVEGPASLTAYASDNRLAIIRTRHDLGGAWARDNLGNWEFDVTPGGVGQREQAFRLGVNLVLYALCLNYKDEEPHRRFGREIMER
jgi:Domain of unknown function (DUF4159)